MPGTTPDIVINNLVSASLVHARNQDGTVELAVMAHVEVEPPPDSVRLGNPVSFLLSSPELAMIAARKIEEAGQQGLNVQRGLVPDADNPVVLPVESLEVRAPNPQEAFALRFNIRQLDDSETWQVLPEVRPVTLSLSSNQARELLEQIAVRLQGAPDGGYRLALGYRVDVLMVAASAGAPVEPPPMVALDLLTTLPGLDMLHVLAGGSNEEPPAVQNILALPAAHARQLGELLIATANRAEGADPD